MRPHAFTCTGFETKQEKTRELRGDVLPKASFQFLLGNTPEVLRPDEFQGVSESQQSFLSKTGPLGGDSFLALKDMEQA